MYNVSNPSPLATSYFSNKDSPFAVVSVFCVTDDVKPTQYYAPILLFTSEK